MASHPPSCCPRRNSASSRTNPFGGSPDAIRCGERRRGRHRGARRRCARQSGIGGHGRLLLWFDLQGSGYSVEFSVGGSAITDFLGEVAYTCGGFPAYGVVGFDADTLDRNGSFFLQSTEYFVTQTISGTVTDDGTAAGLLRLDYADGEGLYCTTRPRYTRR